MQCARKVLCVSPNGFCHNEQTAEDNAFSSVGDMPQAEIENRALEEHAGLVQLLREKAKIEVMLFEGASETPDACFPNNWFTTHQDKTLILYPMLAKNRQKERKPKIIDFLSENALAVLDVSRWEQQNIILEGTGSMVLDRTTTKTTEQQNGGTGFMAISSRSHPKLAEYVAHLLRLENLFCFDAIDQRGIAAYHTNVVLSIGRTFAIVCLDSVRDPQQRETLKSLLAAKHQIIEITLDQMDHFCANCLEVESTDGNTHSLVMSSTAFHAFTAEQIAQLNKHVDQILHTPLNTIEGVGGGSARCCMAELFF